MRFNRNIGFLLLAIWLILTGSIRLHLNAWFVCDTCPPRHCSRYLHFVEPLIINPPPDKMGVCFVRRILIARLRR